MNLYWKKRNRLVDNVKRVTPTGDRVWVAIGDRTPAEDLTWFHYRLALGVLRAFDKSHGGAPIL